MMNSYAFVLGTPSIRNAFTENVNKHCHVCLVISGSSAGSTITTTLWSFQLAGPCAGWLHSNRAFFLLYSYHAFHICTRHLEVVQLVPLFHKCHLNGEFQAQNCIRNRWNEARDVISLPACLEYPMNHSGTVWTWTVRTYFSLRVGMSKQNLIQENMLFEVIRSFTLTLRLLKGYNYVSTQSCIEGLFSEPHPCFY